MIDTGRSDARSLAGSRVVVTRAEQGDGPLSLALSELGAEVLNWPVVAFAPPVDVGPLDRAIRRLGEYDWIAFTSRRAVEALDDRDALSFEAEDARPRIAAIGESTAARLRRAGCPVDLQASPASGEGLVAGFARLDCAGARVLFPASEIARDTVPDGLEALGATVERVTAYRVVATPLDREACLRELASAAAPIVTFTSPSAVHGLREALGEYSLARLLTASPVVVIGETTGRALSAAGFSPTRIADTSTLDGLVEAVARVAQEVPAT